MQVPHYHKKRSWQIFIVGVFTGSIIAYLVLVSMYGKMYEHVLTDKLQLQTEVNELKRQNEALSQDKENLEEKSNPTILNFSISFISSKELQLDRLIAHQLEDLLKNELSTLIGKSVDSIAENDELLITLIENKTLTIDDLTYQFKVEKLFISKHVKLVLKVTDAE